MAVASRLFPAASLRIRKQNANMILLWLAQRLPLATYAMLF
jgi:hypothetical protein